MKTLMALCWAGFFALGVAGGAEPTVNLEHGEAEVARMLADRPAMAHYVRRDGKAGVVDAKDAVWQEVARDYGTEVNGCPIDWDGGTLEKPLCFLSEHVIPGAGTPGLIRLRADFQSDRGWRPATFDELWACAVFELINVRNAERFLAIYHQALQSRMSRAEWIDRNTRLEYSALTQLRDFYRTTWLPWSVQQNRTSESLCWLRNTPDTYEQWISYFQGKDDSYLKYWGGYYDQTIAPNQPKG